ncbi:molybdenum cofactor guanylyltransferase MobA [Falsirhodobacter sp. 20TX0035]|uniref:molybdenum cofactor guanylyltransferase MobA n=1 Tax=Falsirhodobacter sp. 20TX0035 TaxID=3022019 RepID=UPI002330510D|nr:molybdenum cofactor guanylyltransferase MobA [Falsirhodobacter sp. 20TX0035]MDB6453022.1 molybdenum cofactor guanylyltransferase MobA [Falsirhodobacter sp. 20TX0035]
MLAVILAGGRAQRMGGGDKCRLDLGGTTILDEILRRLRPQCARVVLSANGDPSRFADLGLTVLPDAEPDHPGPLAGLLAGMDHAAGLGMNRVLTLAGDTPFLPPDLCDRLRGDGAIALAASNGVRHPTVGVWRVDLREDLRAALRRGERAVGRWAMRHDARLVEFPVEDHDPFFNVNTPEDLETARAIHLSAR